MAKMKKKTTKDDRQKPVVLMEILSSSEDETDDNVQQGNRNKSTFQDNVNPKVHIQKIQDPLSPLRTYRASDFEEAKGNEGVSKNSDSPEFRKSDLASKSKLLQTKTQVKTSQAKASVKPKGGKLALKKKQAASKKDLKQLTSVIFKGNQDLDQTSDFSGGCTPYIRKAAKSLKPAAATSCDDSNSNKDPDLEEKENTSDKTSPVEETNDSCDEERIEVETKLCPTCKVNIEVNDYTQHVSRCLQEKYGHKTRSNSTRSLAKKKSGTKFTPYIIL